MSSIVTLSLVGLFVGFIFSMPIAGPISILVTSNALKGRTRYCNLAAIGSSVADFIYVFCAVFGLTRFYSIFKPAIPYILLGGMVFLFVLGYKISKTMIDPVNMEDKNQAQPKTKQKNAFLTGFLLNFLNPTLFISWLTSSFIVITVVASLGFSTGGLDQRVDKSFNSINKKGQDSALKKKALSYLHLDSVSQTKPDPKAPAPENPSEYFSLVPSVLYAFFLSVGGALWFFCLASFLSKNRHRININIIRNIIRSLGWALYLFALFLGYQALSMFTS